MSYFVDTKPENFALERTSACHGGDNPGGYGWRMTYCDGEVQKVIVIPDNVMREWANNIKAHYDRRQTSADDPL